MNVFVGLFSEPWVQRLGWVLIHFLWQGTAIALLLAVALRLLTRASSHVRYVAIGGALLTCALMPVVTWTILGSSPTPPSAFSATAPNPAYVANVEAPVPLHSNSHLDVTDRSPGPAGIRWPDRLHQAADAALPYVVCLWFGGVLILTLRLTLVWTLMRRLCLSGLPVMDSLCQERFRNLLERMQITLPVRLLESALVEVPTLIGWLRPTILVPASVFTGLSPDQLEAILAHELAHVRRYDYLVNLFQTVIETILFYHPAVWWISRKLREERENCCDDLALDVMQNRLVYVSALAQLEQTRAMPPALMASGGSLLRRIRRIASADRRKSSLLPVIVTALIVGFVVLPLAGQMTTTKPKTSHDSSTVKNPALTKALIVAAKQGDIAQVDRLLKQGADPNAEDQDPDGYWNALIAAVGKNHVDVVKLLLQNGADPNFKNCDPNEFALSYVKNAAMVKILLDAGANPNGKDDVRNDLLTPLMNAPDPESVRLLVQHGANLNPKLTEDMTLLEEAVGNGVGNRVHDPNLGDRWDVVAEMIKLGAKFDPKGNGPTLLVDAAGQGKVKIARGLLDSGVNPDSYATRGIFLISPLTEAAFARSPDMIKLLLSRGAHLSACRGNSSPLSAALNTGRYDNADVLRQAGASDVSYFSEFCARGDLAKVNELIQAGANVNETDPRGQTPLMYAVRRGHPEIAKVLLEHGANINQFNSGGSTAYVQFEANLAVLSQYPGISPARLEQDDWGVRADEATQRLADLESFFKQHPSNPNYRDSSGRTALHQAALTGNTSTLDYLLALKPDVNMKDNKGNTPLLLAALSPLAGNLATRYVDKASAKEWNAEARITYQLIKAGAKLDLVLANGKTVGESAMAAAQKAKNPQLISVLHDAGVAETVSPPKSPDLYAGEGG